MTSEAFPREYDCPDCGSKVRVSEKANDEIYEQKNKERPPGISAMDVQVKTLQAAGTALLTIPVLVIYTDICYDCGNIYRFRIDKQETPITAQMPKPGGPGSGQLPPGFNLPGMMNS